MTEEEQLLFDVVEACDERSLLVFHSRDSRRDLGNGFPDLVIVGPGGVLFRELKGSNETLRSAQTVWKWRLSAAGARWGLWRPCHWKSGKIKRELNSIR